MYGPGSGGTGAHSASRNGRIMAKHQLGAVEHTRARRHEVRGAWQDSELGLREAGEVAHNAAAEHPEQLHDVLKPDHVGVADDDQHLGRDPRHAPLGPVEVRRVEPLELPDEVLEVVRVGREPLVLCLQRRKPANIAGVIVGNISIASAGMPS